MSEHVPDIVERLHRAEMERVREEQRRGDELVEQMHHAALADRPKGPATPVGPETLHYTELPEAQADSPLRREWDFYRRQVGRLLAEGHCGRHILIKGEQVIGMWDTHEEALLAGCMKFPGQPILVHQIQERERVLRCGGVVWRNLPSR
jgi:hypothetical protein